MNICSTNINCTLRGIFPYIYDNNNINNNNNDIIIIIIIVRAKMTDIIAN